jgi:hypothetical protein
MTEVVSSIAEKPVATQFARRVSIKSQVRAQNIQVALQGSYSVGVVKGKQPVSHQVLLVNGPTTSHSKQKVMQAMPADGTNATSPLHLGGT